MASDGVDLIPYDGAVHGAFLTSTFRSVLQENPPWCYSSINGHQETLAYLLRNGAPALVAVPVGHPDDLLGWAVGYHDALVFAYVRQVVRRRGIARALVNGLNLARPTPVVYWTRACSRIAGYGAGLYFDVDTLEAVTAMAQ